MDRFGFCESSDSSHVFDAGFGCEKLLLHPNRCWFRSNVASDSCALSPPRFDDAKHHHLRHRFVFFRPAQNLVEQLSQLRVCRAELGGINCAPLFFTIYSRFLYRFLGRSSDQGRILAQTIEALVGFMYPSIQRDFIAGLYR